MQLVLIRRRPLYHATVCPNNNYVIRIWLHETIGHRTRVRRAKILTIHKEVDKSQQLKGAER